MRNPGRPNGFESVPTLTPARQVEHRRRERHPVGHSQPAIGLVANHRRAGSAAIS
jgi:hypothetical protein